MSPALQANSLPPEPPGKPIYIGLLLLLLSHSLMSDSLSPHGLQHAKFSSPSCQVFLSFIISRILLKLMSIESVMPSNHLILCLPLLLLPSIFPIIRVFSNELALHQEAKALKLRLQHLSSQ